MGEVAAQFGLVHQLFSARAQVAILKANFLALELGHLAHAVNHFVLFDLCRRKYLLVVVLTPVVAHLLCAHEVVKFASPRGYVHRHGWLAVHDSFKGSNPVEAARLQTRIQFGFRVNVFVVIDF